MPNFIMEQYSYTTAKIVVKKALKPFLNVGQSTVWWGMPIVPAKLT